jgi:hypothetical protein
MRLANSQQDVIPSFARIGIVSIAKDLEKRREHTVGPVSYGLAIMWFSISENLSFTYRWQK